MVPQAKEVLDYWFGNGYESLDKGFFPGSRMQMWFRGGEEVDKHVTENFKGDVEKVADGSYDSWLESDDPLDGMAAVILMDQFTRNIYRGSPKAFSLDRKALQWANQLLESGKADSLPHILRSFLFLPHMHSEELAVQKKGVEIQQAELAVVLATLGPEHPVTKFAESTTKYAQSHLDVVEKWGRFPHRNAVLGRADTEEEAAGMADGTIAKF